MPDLRSQVINQQPQSVELYEVKQTHLLQLPVPANLSRVQGDSRDGAKSGQVDQSIRGKLLLEEGELLSVTHKKGDGR